MYDQTRGDILFTILYSVVMAITLLSGCYLLFSKANAFVPRITPPVRLRRWTGVFLASIAVSQMWYMQLFFLSSSEDIEMADLIGGLMQSVTILPVAIIVLLAMLQDRKRPLWPFALMIAPAVLGLAACVVSRSKTLYPLIYAYDLPLIIGIIIYMVRALRQYGRWLRDNYADLEHKEVWQSFVVLAIILLVFCIYVSSGEGPSYEYLLQLIVVVLIGYLLWRVETLSDLSVLHPQVLPADETATEVIEGDSLLPTIRDNIGALLQQHCIDEQLYLQHDLTVAQLAQAIGINRLYLSQYFSRQGLSYNAYINDLRINHFVSLYREALATQRPFTAQQLAHDCGYQSYSTFSLAFKQRMGQSVTAWMRNADK